MDYSICLLLLVSSFSTMSTGRFPSPQIIKEWVEQLQEQLITLTDTSTSMHELVQIYKAHRPYYTVEYNNASKLVATAARNIEGLLGNRSEALKRLATHAERLQMDHVWREWKDDSEIEKVLYYNAKDDGNKTEKKRYIPDDFHEDPDFKRTVSYNTTAVHIPTDIYEGSTIIMNELNWTEALEEVFRKNKEEDPSLLWQVFGSATGLARYYPASPWITHLDKVDQYDVRRRPWYIQGAASPKDMLIVVDASGSVSGFTLKLIRSSVNEMLETLSDDDYVNVVFFNEKAFNAVKCFQSLVQANVRNKKVLKEGVKNITAKGITNLTAGFELAFEQLAQNVSRANCNKIIMLFTDGGEERAEEFFKKYNPKQAVRIFTFSVGRHSYDKAPIKSMACNNKGYYYEIPSIGAIRLNTQEYLDVLGRPMVKAGEKAKTVQWTNVYLDALDLGLVITGTLPVFNKTKTGPGKSQSQLILGVMAIDVSLEDIKSFTPRFSLGPNGYYFAIDPNGYVLLHPNLQPPTDQFKDPVTLDFLDAEIENEIKVKIRREMIDGETRQYTISTLVKSQDERYIDQGRRTYTFGPVKGTDYSLALVLPDYSMRYIRANIGDTITQARWKNVSESLLVDKFDEYGHTFIAPRMYCNDLKPDKNENNTEFLMRFNDYIDTKTPNDPMCKVELVNRLLLDAGITAELIKKWRESYNREQENKMQESVVARFVATDGGITRVYPESAGPSWKEEPETYESSFYKRSLDNDLYIFTPYPANASDESGLVLVSRAINLDIDGFTLKPAVVGVKLDVDAWMETFINTTQKANCRDEICGCKRDDEYVDCFLVDDGGFLVMSNKDYEIGSFLGVIDPFLMSQLNDSLFAIKKTFDYQSRCDPEQEGTAAAGLRSVYVPTIADILSLGWWVTAAAWSVVQQLLVSITLPSVLDAAEMDDEAADAMRNKEVCITEQTQIYFMNDSLSFERTVNCDVNCSRMYLAEKLPKTNLVFIIADAKRHCPTCVAKEFKREEVKSEGPNPCELAQSPRYRKQPQFCFDRNDHETSKTDCGGASGLSPSLWLTMALQLVMLWVLTGSRHHAISS